MDHQRNNDGQFATITWQTGLTLTVLVMAIDAQWEGMWDVASARYDHKGFKIQ